MADNTTDTSIPTTSDPPTDSVSVTTVTTTSVSLTTSPTTTITITDTSTSTPGEPTTSPTPEPPTVTSTTSVPPSTTFVEPTTSESVIDVTSTTTLTPSPEPTTPPPTTPSVIVVTSTQHPDTSSLTNTATGVTTTPRPSPTPSALSASGSGSGSSGLSSGGKIAIAVIIPIAAIAAAFFIGFCLWRKRKNRKNNEELRKNEMAEYGYNPNSDPTLVVGGTAYTDNASEAQDENSGYRGWGATSSNRKASTTLGSNGRAAGGLAMSESSSQPGGYAHGSPNAASDHYSADPLMNGHPEGTDGVGALGASTGLNRNRSGAAGVRRGPSNASSTYSEGHVSEVSSDNQSYPGPYNQDEVPYNIYNDAAPSHGPFGDGSYGGSGGQPVIRDVQARRNTRIERAPTFPQTQGGISQNF